MRKPKLCKHCGTKNNTALIYKVNDKNNFPTLKLVKERKL